VGERGKALVDIEVGGALLFLRLKDLVPAVDNAWTLSAEAGIPEVTFGGGERTFLHPIII
jgi:hypothetical protein